MSPLSGAGRAEFAPAARRSIIAVFISVVLLLALNASFPSFAKGFDLPLGVTLAVAVFVNPRLALMTGLLAGLILDTYAGRLFLFHTIYYCLPALTVMVFGESLLSQSSVLALFLTGLFVVSKFAAQYAWLFLLGNAEWPGILLGLNWWGALWILVCVALFWRKLGGWLAGQSRKTVLGSGIDAR